MHPNKKEGVAGHNAKLRQYTRDYGAADPKMYHTAAVDKLNQNGPQESVGYGADSSAPKARGDRPARKTAAANPVSTYATGGAVAARARGGRTKKGATHVNVIVAPQAPNPSAGATPPLGALPGMGPGGPPMPPGAGGPPPGMPMPPRGVNPMMGAMQPPGAMPPGVPPRKRGGSVKEHPDVTEDRALIKAMVKPGALKRATGGRLNKHHMTAGAATGEGRLEKIGKKAKDAGSPQTV